VVNYSEIIEEDTTSFNSTHNVLDQFKNISVEDRREICKKDRMDYYVCVLNVTGELNVGTIVRTSLLAGAREVLIVGRKRFDNRSTVGSYNYIDVTKYDAMSDETTIDCDEFVKICETRKLYPIFVELGGVEIPNFDWKDTISWINSMGMYPMLVLGNEGRGVPEELLDGLNSCIVSLPQKGVMRSYNVGVAHAMVTMDMMTKMNWW
jgi:tRNA G18 (ribose-2'-O)-methylase SpoU